MRRRIQHVVCDAPRMNERQHRQACPICPNPLAPNGAVTAWEERTASRRSRRLGMICYLAVLPMNKTNKHTVATPDLDPARIAQLKALERQRKRASRVLLKRRRQKSGQ
jgi:hypothetical protein